MGNQPRSTKAPWWGLVGLALTLDKRLLVVLPCMCAAGYAVSKFIW